jgi:hypothetical protein
MVAKVLLEQAQRCWRLAKSIYNQEAAAELEAYARQLEEQARRLEQEERQAQPSGAATSAWLWS